MLAEIVLRFPRAVGRAFTSRVRDLTQDSPALKEVTSHLLLVYDNVLAEEAKLDRRLRGMARNDETVRRFMTVPAIGSFPALAYSHAIDDPGRSEDRQVGKGCYSTLRSRRWPYQ